MQRTHVRGDARSVAVELTAKGAELRTEAVAFRTGWLALILDRWDPSDVQTFAIQLARFADAVAERDVT